MMRLLAALGSLVVAVTSGVAFGWVATTIVLRGLFRWLERRRPLRHGSVAACAVLLLGIATAASCIMVWASVLLFNALASPKTVIGFTQPWLLQAWHGLVFAAALLVAVAAILAAFGAALDALGAARRQRLLLQPGPDHLPVPASGTEGRRIVILCDGTSNRPDQQEDGESAVTNIVKLYRGLGCDDTQVTWYQAGVGSDTSSTAAEARRTQAVLAAVGANAGSRVVSLWSRAVKLGEAAFGSGISEGIINGYSEVVRQYRPGDRIYLLGFSRGAYTARCIAGVISRCGLLRAENLRFAPDMVRLYRNRTDQQADEAVRPDMVHPDPAIHFVGVFDTVASLGVPLWGWWFRVLPIWKNRALATDPVQACRHVYHALSMDERRSQFFPTLYNDPRRFPPDQPRRNDKLETLEQVWFRGAHADVGGGYARHDLSDIPLAWMMDAMKRHGLRFKDGARDALRPDTLGRPHDEMAREPGWVLLGSWPRWHPVPGGTPDLLGTTLHGSVVDRSRTVTARTGRPDMVAIPAGDHRDIVVDARRDWDRTGMVIEQGAMYRITYRGTEWRDAEAPPCGPAGQQAQGLDARRVLGFGRRLPAQPWMRLVATVAHPRAWPLEERGFWALARLIVFHNDPRELTRQLAAIGRDLATPGSAVLIHNLAPSGLLYLFANDWWQTASNNSGGLTLRITRVVDGVVPDVPVWTLHDHAPPAPRNRALSRNSIPDWSRTP